MSLFPSFTMSLMAFSSLYLMLQPGTIKLNILKCQYYVWKTLSQLHSRTGYTSATCVGFTATSDCFCLGQTLSYECTTEGPISTVWQGTAFQCVGNRIVLRHSQFTASPQGTAGECSDGLNTITGRSLRVSGDCHTSQLNVTLSSSLNSQTIECAYSGGGTSLIGSSIIDISKGKINMFVNLTIICFFFVRF